MLYLKGHAAGSRIHSLAFAPDGQSLASSGQDGTVRLWNLNSGEHDLLFESKKKCYSSTVAFSPDGRWLGWNVQAQDRLRDLAAGKEQSLYSGKKAVPGTFAFSPDKNTLVVAIDGSLDCWAVKGWKLRNKLRDCGERTDCLAFALDGKSLAAAHRLPGPRTSSRRFVIRLRDLPTGGMRQELTDPTQPVRSLAYSPDGSMLACTYGSSWRVWNVASGELVQGYKIMHREFLAVEFTRNGRFLTVSQSDQTVRHLDTKTWKETAAFKWKIGRVECLAYTPDGMKGAGGGNKGVIVVWDMDM